MLESLDFLVSWVFVHFNELKSFIQMEERFEALAANVPERPGVILLLSGTIAGNSIFSQTHFASFAVTCFALQVHVLFDKVLAHVPDETCILVEVVDECVELLDLMVGFSE